MSVPPLPSPAVRIARVQAFVLRSPIAVPVRTSFGVMHDRPAVFVRVEDQDGAAGWGEVWCNFPACGAEHRARVVETVYAPLLTASAFDGPAAAFRSLEDATAVLAIQSGEHGPMAHALAGIDLALWDLCARRAGQPLWRYLGGSDASVPVYASGINPDKPQDVVERRRADGYRAFKLKIGFGRDTDVANVRQVRALLGDGTPLMVDANQGWSLDVALAMARELEPFGLGWLEEPLRADRPWAEWQQLARTTPLPLAAGENVAGTAGFDAAIASNTLRVLQPDAAKWGGISGNWPVVHTAMASGLRFCPHYLGGGIGLLHSAHLLAAAGGGGLLEVDANANPLRSVVAPLFEKPVEGRCTLGEEPGIGPAPDIAQLRRSIERA
jgi:L-alanine-DL-glutamate epimerase-like enolase superfamily enzyme